MVQIQEWNPSTQDLEPVYIMREGTVFLWLWNLRYSREYLELQEDSGSG